MESYDEAAAKKDLDGVLLDYTYPSGRHYSPSIKIDKFDFTSPWPGEQRKAPPPRSQSAGQGSIVIPPSGGVDYHARKIQEGMYLVHWIVNKQIHVALILDFVNKRVFAAGLLPGQIEQWETTEWDRWVLPSEALKKYQGTGHK